MPNVNSLPHGKLLTCAKLKQNVSNVLEEKNTGWPLEDLNNVQKYNHLFCPNARKQTLGKGGDGIVYVCCILQEFNNLRALGSHDNIIEAQHYTDNYKPGYAAMFLPFCKLGDLVSYRGQRCTQQRLDDQLERVSEVSTWNFLKDMSLGLDFLHNQHAQSYVHSDFKPGNILVSFPADWKAGHGIPEEPIFKIADFARLKKSPAPPGHEPCGWKGTYEFVPPMMEQCTNIRHSSDIWSLGETMQSFMLKMLPTQSHEAFIRNRYVQGLRHPPLLDHRALQDDSWRSLIPVIHRPLDASERDLRTKHDLAAPKSDYHLYPHQLNAWYAALWRGVFNARITSQDLVRYVVPLTNGEIAIAKQTSLADECFEKARKLHDKVRERQAARLLTMKAALDEESKKAKKAPGCDNMGSGNKASLVGIWNIFCFEKR